MRRIILILFLALSKLISAQNLVDLKVDLNFKNNSIVQCLKSIEHHTGITFSYNLTTIKAENKVISKTFKQTTVGQALNSIFEGTSLKFKEIADQITIYSDQSQVNLVSISGYISEKSSGEKLIGAKLYVPEIKDGCTSNPYGFYHFEIPKGTYDFVIFFSWNETSSQNNFSTE